MVTATDRLKFIAAIKTANSVQSYPVSGGTSDSHEMAYRSPVAQSYPIPVAGKRQGIVGWRLGRFRGVRRGLRREQENGPQGKHAFHHAHSLGSCGAGRIRSVAASPPMEVRGRSRLPLRRGRHRSQGPVWRCYCAARAVSADPQLGLRRRTW